MTVAELVTRIREDLKAGRAVSLHFFEEYATATVPLTVEDQTAENATFSSPDGRSTLILTSEIEIVEVYRLVGSPQLAVTLGDGQSDVDVLLELRPDDDQYPVLTGEPDHGYPGLGEDDN